MPPVVPKQLEEVTPEWLTGALQARFPDAQVDQLAVTEVAHGTNTHAKLCVRYATPSDLPERLFLKIPPLNDAMREAVNQTGMGRREALFYRHMAETVPMRVPRPYVAEFEPASGAFVLVIEDLEATGCSFPDLVRALCLEQAALAMDDLAALHVRFEDPQRRASEAGFVERMPRGSTFGTGMLQIGLDQHRERLTDAFAELAALYIEKQSGFEDAWEKGSVTVLQGDTHIGNLFEEPGAAKRPGFLDWGLLHLGTPMRDVGYFLIMALSPETRRRHERELIERYLEARRERQGEPLDFEEAWTLYRVHASYAVPASCPMVTFRAKPTPATDAFLRRAEVAIEDLEARAALADFAGL